MYSSLFNDVCDIAFVNHLVQFVLLKDAICCITCLALPPSLYSLYKQHIIKVPIYLEKLQDFVKG